MLKVGDKMPEATLRESPAEQDETNHCPMPPKPVKVSDICKGKKVVFFGVPGAFTPTCSGRHVPSFVENLSHLKEKGVDEVCCVAVNDGFVMSAWGASQKAGGKIRFLGDGEGELAKALGIDVVLPGMGLRNRRFSMLVNDGVIEHFNVEEKGFEVSDAKTLLTQMSQKH